MSTTEGSRREDETTSGTRNRGGIDYNYEDCTNINGSGSGKLPYFDGKNFSHYKHRMKMYLRSIGLPIWKIVETGYRLENEASPTPTDERNMHKDSQAVSAIFSSLSPKEYSRVVGLQNAREVWIKLCAAHEGVDTMKKSRLQVLKNKFNFFVMYDNEDPQQTHDRLMDIINEMRSLFLYGFSNLGCAYSQVDCLDGGVLGGRFLRNSTVEAEAIAREIMLRFKFISRGSGQPTESEIAAGFTDIMLRLKGRKRAREVEKGWEKWLCSVH